MNNLITTKFLKGIRWNFIEAIVYRIILLIHHLFLFKVVESSFYGLIGTIFSSVYLTVSLANLGLDNSIGIFFDISIKSKAFFKHIFLRHIYTQISIFVLLALLFMGSCTTISHIHSVFSIDSNIACIVALILVSEGIKKTVRSLLQYAFLNQITTTIEIVYLLLYVLTIWGSYASGITITIYSIFIPFLCMSLLSNLLLISYVYRWYCTLPECTESILPARIKKRLLYNRVLNTSNNIGRNLFTHNFLVTLFAFRYGLQQAAAIKIIGTISETIASLIYKTFSRMSNALLSHTKHSDKADKQKTFLFLTHIIHQGIYLSTILLILNYPLIASFDHFKDISISPMVTILLFAISTGEHFFIAYERFYIIEESIITLLVFNLIGTGAWLILILTSPSPTLLLLGLLAIRITLFSMMSHNAYKRWKITPSWKIESKTAATAIIATILIALLHR